VAEKRQGEQLQIVSVLTISKMPQKECRAIPTFVKTVLHQSENLFER
jgi:hypothetical protein